jgi:hypothetical protein
MASKQTQLFEPPAQSLAVDESRRLAPPLREWLFSVQNLLPLVEVDTTAGNLAITLPPAGLNSSTGQSAQNQEIIYIKTSADAHTATIAGALTGSATLKNRYDIARFKSDGTNWINSGVGGSLTPGVSLETNGVSNALQTLLNLIAGNGMTLTADGAGGVTLAGPQFKTNGVLNALQTLLNLKAGTNMTLTPDGAGGVTLDAAAGGSASSIQGVAVSASTPLTGDTLRYNEWGDSKWDVCQGAPFIRGWYADLFNAAINAFNANTNPAIGSGSALARQSATATEPAAQKNLTSAVASTLVTCYIAWQSAGINPFSWGTVKRMSMRLQLLHAANVRYFFGLFANASTPPVGTGTDTPNIHYAAFRYSAGTDATIKAVCGTATATLTVVDTGVAVDTTASHVFDIAFDGVNVNFFIDGVLKAQISTTLPSAADTMQPSVMCDNKNTANAVGWQFAWMVITPK